MSCPLRSRTGDSISRPECLLGGPSESTQGQCGHQQLDRTAGVCVGGDVGGEVTVTAKHRAQLRKPSCEGEQCWDTLCLLFSEV